MRIRSAAQLLSVAVGVALFTPSLSAQALAAPMGEAVVANEGVATTPSSTAPAARTAVSGPRRNATVAGVQTARADAPLPEPVQARRNSASTAATLTILGGVGFVGGLLINNDAGNAIAVAGLASALIGIYLWLK